MDSCALESLNTDFCYYFLYLNQQTLLQQLERCAEGLQKAERYESMGALYKLIIPFYEKQRDFQVPDKQYLHFVFPSWFYVIQMNVNRTEAVIKVVWPPFW